MDKCKTGDILICSECGAELEVKKDCSCSDCSIVCCGKPMEVKDKSSDNCCCC